MLKYGIHEKTTKQVVKPLITTPDPSTPEPIGVPVLPNPFLSFLLTAFFDSIRRSSSLSRSSFICTTCLRAMWPRKQL